ncbi:MAG: cytochrome C [Ignavibacteriales bacterium]|nr:cytochrome C [Ignavibacteriales bacterium]
MRISPTVKQLSVIHIYLLIVGVLLLLIASTFVTQSREGSVSEDRGKSIKFSHTFHIKEVGMGCVDCHEGATTSTSARDNLLSTKATCQTCHEEQLQNDCTFCHTSDDPSSYAKFLNPRRDLLFNHAFHIDEQKMACETCHQGLDEMTLATPGSLPAMVTCNTCHNDVLATNACETCHTNFAALRPKEHNRTDFVRVHKFSARMQDATCMSCHTDESCQDCHTNAGLDEASPTGRDLVSPRSPRLTANDRAQGMALQKVHDPNFRFTHGVAASAKSSDCATCHSTRDFCSTCHPAGGNVTQFQFRPLTHQQPRFVTLGFGSGGGLHAQLARRDIESCAACHDAQGADPTCVTCHLDTDGIKNTDPRTHQRGFMATVNGDWHGDPGASCYVCHADPNAHINGIRGVGFCGYCHK